MARRKPKVAVAPTPQEPPARPSIITFVKDPGFLGLKISEAQEALLRGIYGLPLVNVEQARIWDLCAERPYLVGHQYPEASVLAAARSGKDLRIAAPVVIYEAIWGGHAEAASKGEKVMIPLIAQDAEAAGIAFGYIKAYMTENPVLAAMVRESLANRIVLTNGVTIRCFPCTRTTTRGYSIPVAVLDEVSFFRLEGSANSDAEIQASIRRGMIAFPGTSRLIKISTPYMSDGVMYDDHRRAFGKPDPDLLAWRATSKLMNPSITQERLDREQRLDPIRFKREYLAEFIEGLAAFLPRHLIDRAVQKGRYDLAPRDGIKYVVAVDANQGGADAFTIAVVHAEGTGADLRVVQDFVEGRATRGDSVVILEDIVRDYAAIAQRYHQKRVYGDRLTTAKHGGWIVEAFRRYGIEYVTDHVLGPDRKPRYLTASDAYVAVEPLFTQGRIELLDHEVQTKEFGQLEKHALPGGDSKVTHPKGDKFHDDHSNATSLAAAIASWLRVKPKVFEGMVWDPVARSAVYRPEQSRPEATSTSTFRYLGDQERARQARPAPSDDPALWIESDYVMLVRRGDYRECLAKIKVESKAEIPAATAALEQEAERYAPGDAVIADQAVCLKLGTPEGYAIRQTYTLAWPPQGARRDGPAPRSIYEYQYRPANSPLPATIAPRDPRGPRRCRKCRTIARVEQFRPGATWCLKCEANP